MTIIAVKVRFSSGETVDVTDVDDEITISDLKKLLFDRKLTLCEPEKQRLIFKGRILQDEQTVQQVGIQEGLTLHLVKSSAAKSTSSSSPGASAPTGAPGQRTTNTTNANPFGAGPPPPMFADPFGMGLGGGAGGGFGMGGMPGGGGFGMGGMPGMPGMPAPSPEMMRQMMENPMVQRLLENPETIRAMIQANPMMRAMVEQNPQLEQVLSDPQIMRQAMQAAANPAVMQELMRSQDRALANIESLPGGHNALRRMYEQDIDPMVRAAEETSERMYEQQQQQQRAAAAAAATAAQPGNTTSTGPSASPMPNPWGTAPSSTQQQQTAAPNLGAAFNPWAAAAGAGQQAGGANPFAAMMGGAGGGNPFASMGAMMQDPEYMRRLMEPANLQAMMQLQQAMQQLQRGGVFPEGSFPSMPIGLPPMQQPEGGGAGAAPFPGMGFGGIGFPGGMPAAAPPTPLVNQQPPEVRFASQLSQLESMGFGDRESNIRALTATNGNVNAAIERLLQ